MPGSANLLTEVHKQLNEDFKEHPIISVQPSKGAPPEQYTITYFMAGYHQGSTEEISLAEEHVVELSIPFGFPHFPPSCKPKSNTFHPDFDSAAICLGKAWEQEASIANIILYIGKMINGEIYSTQNAFNDKAAVWYQKHSKKFPITPIAWESNIQSRRATGASTSILEEDRDPMADSSPGPDNESPSFTGEEEPSGRPLSDGTEDIDLLKQLRFQKRFHELSQRLRFANDTSPEVQAIKEQAELELKKNRKLYQEAQKIENLGSTEKALEHFKLVKKNVSDYPSIETDIQRLQQAIELLSDIDPDQFPPEANEKKEQAKKKTSAPRKRGKKRKPIQTKRSQNSFLDARAAKDKKRRLAQLGLVIFVGGLIVGGTGLYYLRSGSLLAQAEEDYTRCKKGLEQREYTKAKELCSEGITRLDSIKFFHQQKTEALRSEINDILKSKELRDGSKGLILVDGRYLDRQQSEKFEKIDQLIKQADSSFANRKWEKALQQYSMLLDEREFIQTFFPKQRNLVQERRHICQFQSVLSSANQFIDKGQWQLAVGGLTQARTLLDKLPAKEKKTYGEKIDELLNRCTFEITLKKANSAFNREDWKEAVKGYQASLAIANTTPTVSQEQKQKIASTISRSRLYLTIDKANKAFAQGKWNEAIKAYSEASSALASDKALLDESRLDISRKKLGKIILQASIIQHKQTVKSQLENKQLREAKRLYKEILQLIKASGYSSDPEMVKARKEIHTTLEDLDRKIYLSDKEAYLRSKYQNLFASNYPNTVPENLSKPVIKYVKTSGNKLIFRMQCKEKRRGGRPLTLVMFYAYDKTTDQWSLSSEKSSK